MVKQHRNHVGLPCELCLAYSLMTQVAGVKPKNTLAIREGQLGPTHRFAAVLSLLFLQLVIDLRC